MREGQRGPHHSKGQQFFPAFYLKQKKQRRRGQVVEKTLTISAITPVEAFLPLSGGCPPFPLFKSRAFSHCLPLPSRLLKKSLGGQSLERCKTAQMVAVTVASLRANCPAASATLGKRFLKGQPVGRNCCDVITSPRNHVTGERARTMTT